MFPDIKGNTLFYQMEDGVLVATEVKGLPNNNRVFGFHIHSGKSCSGNINDSFADAKEHYNPKESNHPYHAGDMPPIFANRGYGLSIVYLEQFSVDEIVGKTIIIHSNPDDFETQPGGGSGEKIACGEINNYRIKII